MPELLTRPNNAQNLSQVAGIKSECPPASNRNGGRLHVGIPGRLQSEFAHKLVRIIKKYRQNLFAFVTNRDVPPTNNGSERALRPCVIFRKITNCFRSHWGARLYADVRSVFETARRRGIALLHSIRLTLDGHPLPVGP
jgi:hypothetical protein